MNKKTAVDVSQVFLWYGVRWVIRQMDPMRKKKDESAMKSRQILDRMRMEPLELNEYEQIVASEIVFAEDIKDVFSDIGGLDDVLSSLQESVIYPLTMPHLFDAGNRLIGPPKGVLLYGPPGCGKTLIARALAKESGAVFINLHVSTLTEKWYGESQKIVKAVFSLAKKLQPTIVFIDEIDSFLRERQSSDHEVTGMMKAEFMSLWDGLSSTVEDRILILGATNRYHDIDKAILRRMPKRFSINLPKTEQRKKILEILLKGVAIEDESFVMEKVAEVSSGFSGSDLKELCRNAAMVPVRDLFKQIRQENPSIDIRKIDMSDRKQRPLRLPDFFKETESGLSLQNRGSTGSGEYYDLD